MKMKFLIPILVLFWSCAGPGKTTQPAASAPSQPAAGEPMKETAVSEPGKDKDPQENKAQKAQNDLYGVVISFYSKGEGIDEKALMNYTNFLAYFENQYKVKISYEKSGLGPGRRSGLLH
jgi:hypothetical protein